MTPRKLDVQALGTPLVKLESYIRFALNQVFFLLINSYITHPYPSGEAKTCDGKYYIFYFDKIFEARFDG